LVIHRWGPQLQTEDSNMPRVKNPYACTQTAVAMVLALAMYGEAGAEGATEARLQALEKALLTQEQALTEQRKRMLAQEERREIEVLRREILMDSRAGSDKGSVGEGSAAAVASEAATQDAAPRPVGKPPPPSKKSSRATVVKAAKDIGGVLTEKGTLVIEPQLQLSTSQVNAFTFQGVEILDTFLVGVIEAQDNDRNFISPALRFSYGLTNRLEVSLKIPYIYRDDKLKATIPQVDGGDGQPVTLERELDGNGLGDIEASLSYQLNNGQNGWPYFLSNLRYKSTTGEGPFEISRNSEGIERELPTGSGFHAIEPSITMLYPSSPAVFFANIGYLFNLSDDIDKNFGEQRVGKVDPGDATRISFGMGLSLNTRASFTIGYKHDFIQETKTEINGTNFSSSSLDVGALLLGFNFNAKKNMQANLNLELGVTRDAPDVILTLRLPYSLHLF